MTFYIKYKTNDDSSISAVGFPFIDTNLKRIFPDHDFNSSPPTDYLEFEHTDKPLLGAYQKFDASYDQFTNQTGLSFEYADGKIKEVWHILDFTDEEKKAKQDAVKKRWADNDTSHIASWIFNETLCTYRAPVEHPNDGKAYKWNESTTSWEEITE